MLGHGMTVMAGLLTGRHPKLSAPLAQVSNATAVKVRHSTYEYRLCAVNTASVSSIHLHSLYKTLAASC
jgi:hypothetical protein